MNMNMYDIHGNPLNIVHTTVIIILLIFCITSSIVTLVSLCVVERRLDSFEEQVETLRERQDIYEIYL